MNSEEEKERKFLWGMRVLEEDMERRVKALLDRRDRPMITPDEWIVETAAVFRGWTKLHQTEDGENTLREAFGMVWQVINLLKETLEAEEQEYLETEAGGKEERRERDWRLMLLRRERENWDNTSRNLGRCMDWIRGRIERAEKTDFHIAEIKRLIEKSASEVRYE